MKVPICSRPKSLFILASLFALILVIGGAPVRAADQPSQIMPAHPEFRFDAAPKIEHLPSGAIRVTYTLFVTARGSDVRLGASEMPNPFFFTVHAQNGTEITGIHPDVRVSASDNPAKAGAITDVQPELVIHDGYTTPMEVKCTISHRTFENMSTHPDIGAFKLSFDGVICSIDGHGAMPYGLATYPGSTTDYLTLAAPGGMAQTADPAMAAARSALN